MIVDNLKAVLPESLRTQLRSLRRKARSLRRRGLRRVDFGDLNRFIPISRDWGFDRGQPLDRYYIERFLASQREDICGRVLEIADDSYAKRFGGSRVITADILHATADNPAATIVADLAHAPHIPSETFDCVILTETLQLIYDVRAAIATVRRILKPGGVVLATIPGISQVDGDNWEWCWSFTAHSAQRLFEDAFQPSQVSVEAHGNVLLAVAFLHGLCTDDVSSESFQHNDPSYQLVITVRAVKSRTDVQD